MNQDHRIAAAIFVYGTAAFALGWLGSALAIGGFWSFGAITNSQTLARFGDLGWVLLGYTFLVISAFVLYCFWMLVIALPRLSIWKRINGRQNRRS